ncbi:DNA translocase FtsK, partial [candidate division KSB1 bacterium]|nr:DNA translocase FtsK [candidate division KSB1 bacterium]
LEADKPRPAGNYVFPSLELLSVPPAEQQKVQSRDELLSLARVLEERLLEFDVEGKVVEINPGPVITRYEYEPAPGIKVSRITALADDLALAMRAKRIRIVAPIPGKAAVGIELPNPEPQTVYIRDIIESEEFKNSTSPLTIALGQTISGKVYVTSLDRMPHLLIAGATGSGKSVCLNAIILSILYKAHPKEVQFVLVDPKRLELASYRMLRKHHLVYRDDLNEEVVTTAQNALAVLRSLEWEMENRYTLLARVGVRSIAEYNARLKEGKIVLEENGEEGGEPVDTKPLPYIVLVIDELADLMLTAAKEVEEPIARLTQMARAVGIHLVVATQRPSVDVITGVIKANFPARMAFQVASKIDSRTILDMNGAEKLLGSGDMLFLPPGSPEPVRIHGVFVSSDEIERTIEHIRNQPFYEKNLLPVRTEEQEVGDEFGPAADGRRDELFHEALKLVVRHQQGSISLLQRRLKIGYSRAARLIDELEAAGIVGSFDGSKAREVLVDESYLEEMGLNQ